MLAGLGVARVAVWSMNEFAFFSSTDSSLRLVFTFELNSLLVAGAVGMVVTLATVLISSLRISNVNIVAAMRDLPEPSNQKRRRWTVVWPILVALSGLGLTGQAVAADDGILYVVGPTAAVLGLAFTLQRFLPSRALLSLVFVGLVAYSQLAFMIPAVKEANDEGQATFLTGMILVLSAVGAFVLNFPAVVWLVRQSLGRLRRILPVVRLALAYPAERPVRTGFTLGMFSLVIFLETLAGIYLITVTSQTDKTREREMGGFDAIVAVDPLNPVPDLKQRLLSSGKADFADVETISALRTLRVELPQYARKDYSNRSEGDHAAASEGALTEQIIGLDSVFLETTKTELDMRATEFGSDGEVWQALAHDPGLVVVGSAFDGEHWEFRRPVLTAGDTLTLRDPVSGLTYEKRIAGRMSGTAIDWLLQGVLMSGRTIENEFAVSPDAPPATYLLKFAPGTEQKSVANSIEKELIANGAQVRLVSELLELSTSWLNLIRIMQGFIALGLLVGVAGLAVVAARAVHQRRHDVGTLRALGFRRGMVLSYLLAESSFVSLLGIGLGVAAGTLAGYGMYLTYIKDEIGGSFVFPVPEVGVLVSVVYVSGLLFTLLPALRAASMPPAQALRQTE